MMKKWKNLTNDTRYFIITGGRGSGKSFQVGRFAVLLSHYPNEKILYTRQTMTSAQLSIIPEIQEKINLMNRAANFEQSGNTLKNVFSGNEIVFKGLQTSSGDQTASLKSLTGVSCWVLDEAEELTDEAKFDKIDLSFRKKGVQTRIILILNPSSKAHWIYKRFFERKGVAEGFTGIHDDTTYIHTTYKDNERNLDQSFLNRANELKTNNPIKYQHIMLGGWLEKADGIIFTNWKYGVFDDSLVENGQQTPYGPCCLGAVDRDGAEEVYVAACGCSGTCYCACLSAHDALAAVYAAERTCPGSCGGASVGVSSRLRVPNREQHTLGYVCVCVCGSSVCLIFPFCRWLGG